MEKVCLSVCTVALLATLFAEGAPPQVLRPDSLTTFFKKDSLASSPSSGLTCDTCKGFFNVLRDLFDKGFLWDDIAKLSVDVCELLEIEDNAVCQGIVNLFKDEVLTVFDKVGLSSDEACSIVIGNSCSKGYNPWDQHWNVTIPGNKPPVTHHSPEPGSPTTGVLHITDIHVDLLYTPGLTNECGEPLCCRKPNKPGNATTAAGYWGDYKCDIPYHTLVNLMQELKNQSSQYEWVYWTGDLPAHNVWNNSRDSVVDLLTNVTDLMKTYFGEKTVFPSFGNHEGIPVNSFPPPYITGSRSVEWLYNASAERWAVWLDKFPEWDTINATIRRGGYYVVKVRDNLKVISLQTNYCNNENYWLLINSTDPTDQLKWLVEQLQTAELNKEKVHIIGHIAPGLGSCIPVWSLNYHKIVNRFESTIVGQFFGHTHRDSVEIFFDTQNNSRATNVAYISPSVTTYQYVNLGYRFFVIDGNYNGSTSCVMDHINYYMDLNKTTQSKPPVWEFEYSAKVSYDMPDLQPQSWADLVNRFQKNDTLFHEYSHHNDKMYSANAGKTCDASCKYDLMCGMVTSVPGNYGVYDHCKDFADYVPYRRTNRQSRKHC